MSTIMFIFASCMAVITTIPRHFQVFKTFNKWTLAL